MNVWIHSADINGSCLYTQHIRAHTHAYSRQHSFPLFHTFYTHAKDNRPSPLAAAHIPTRSKLLRFGGWACSHPNPNNLLLLSRGSFSNMYAKSNIYVVHNQVLIRFPMSSCANVKVNVNYANAGGHGERTSNSHSECLAPTAIIMPRSHTSPVVAASIHNSRPDTGNFLRDLHSSNLWRLSFPRTMHLVMTEKVRRSHNIT